MRLYELVTDTLGHITLDAACVPWLARRYGTTEAEIRAALNECVASGRVTLTKLGYAF